MPIRINHPCPPHPEARPTKDTAFPHRADGYNLIVLSQWMNPADTGSCTTWARETYEAMKPFRSFGASTRI